MNRLYVKICGLTSPEAVAAAIEAGADAVGFVLTSSVREVSAARAAELARAVPRRVEIVAVTREPSQAEVDEIAAVLRPQRLQAEVGALATLVLPHGMQTLPVLRSGHALPEVLPDLYLYESANSGTGERADWEEAARLARSGGLVLAGGLDPLNVAPAIATVHPAGVDVSSGVEWAPGRKDAALVREFISRARAAARTLSGEEA